MEVRKSDLCMIMKRTGSIILFEILITGCGVQPGSQAEIWRKYLQNNISSPDLPGQVRTKMNINGSKDLDL